MKRFFVLLTFIITIVTIPSAVFAQGIPAPSAVEEMGSQSEVSSDGHTAREEAKGKEIRDTLQAKQLTCNDLTDENFEALGEYFMGQTIGNTQRHAAMNQMMKNMMGEEGEEQMHITLGKRSSGCDTNAPLPSGYNGMPMMQWMMGSASAPWGFGGTKGGGNSMTGNWGNPMFGGWGGFGLGWVFMILFWALIILGIIALVKWMLSGGRTDSSKTPLDILKDRFARGEIDRKEFVQMKKEIV